MYVFLSFFCGSIEKRRLRDFFEEKLETLDFEKKLKRNKNNAMKQKKESVESTFFDWNWKWRHLPFIVNIHILIDDEIKAFR